MLDIHLPDISGYDYLPRDGSAYRFVSTAATWLVAEQDCENDGFGTHLVVVGNSGELATVDAISTASLTWLGARTDDCLGNMVSYLCECDLVPANPASY